MYAVVLITVPSRKEAESIAGKLVGNKLAACVNIISNVNSVFFWQGKIDKAREWLLVVKTKKKTLPKLFNAVQSWHSYTVPEIIALPIISGSKSYLGWIDDCIR